MPNLSIIIPIYNVEPYLEKCIQSVLDQSYEDYELILIDNGSTDKSLEIMKQYQQDNPDKIQIIQQKNYDVSQAMNTGIEKSNCPYIMFVNGDDYMKEELIELMMEEAKETHADLILCNIRIVHSKNDKLMKVCFSGAMKEQIESIHENKDLLHTILPNSWGKIYKKTLFTHNHIRFPLGLSNQDLGTIPKVLCHCNQIVKVNRALYNYNYRPSHPMKNVDYKILDIAKNLRMVKDYYREQRQDQEFHQQLEYFFIEQLLFQTIYHIQYIQDSGIRSELTQEVYQILNKAYPNWINNPGIQELPMRKRIYLKLVHSEQLGKIINLLHIFPIIKSSCLSDVKKI